MKDSLVVLCTGGIGSGKTAVTRLFQAFGVPAYDCDRSARDLYDIDPQLCAAVAAVAGRDVLDAAGRIDRVALAGKIFADASLLEAVEALVHPAVIRDFEAWKARQDSPLVVIESAILLEKPLFAGLTDVTVVVISPEALRMERVMRRGLSEAQVRERMAVQWSDEARAAHADYILENDDRTALVPAVLDIIDKTKRRWKRQI